MRKLFTLIMSIIIIGCNQQVSNIDTAEWSGTISENDEKTKIVKDIMKSYVNNNMASMGEYFHPNAEISVNDAVMTYDEMVVAFASGHENFDNILHSNVIATTMFYNNGRVYTNSWYDWSGTSKKTGNEVKLRGYCSWGWEDDKIISVYNAFDPTQYNQN